MKSRDYRRLSPCEITSLSTFIRDIPFILWHRFFSIGHFWTFIKDREVGRPSSGMRCRFGQQPIPNFLSAVRCWSSSPTRDFKCWRFQITRDVREEGRNPLSGKSFQFSYSPLMQKLLREGSPCKPHVVRPAASLSQNQISSEFKLDGKPPSGSELSSGQCHRIKVASDGSRVYIFLGSAFNLLHL